MTVGLRYLLDLINLEFAALRIRREDLRSKWGGFVSYAQDCVLPPWRDSSPLRSVVPLRLDRFARSGSLVPLHSTNKKTAVSGLTLLVLRGGLEPPCR